MLPRSSVLQSQTNPGPTWVRGVEVLCVRWWWVLLWLLMLMMLYETSSQTRQEEELRLSAQVELLKKERSLALAKNADLTLQINSQSDPDWVELVLRKGLGLVPEGQIKVFFQSVQRGP